MIKKINLAFTMLKFSARARLLLSDTSALNHCLRSAVHIQDLMINSLCTVTLQESSESPRFKVCFLAASVDLITRSHKPLLINFGNGNLLECKANFPF